MAEEYGELLSRVKTLRTDQQLRLLEHLALIVRRRVAKDRNTRSVMELQGLGKDIWADLDAQEYVKKERASWDG